MCFPSSASFLHAPLCTPQYPPFTIEERRRITGLWSELNFAATDKNIRILDASFSGPGSLRRQKNKMKSRVGSNGTLEEGNDPSLKPETQFRPLPLRLLQFVLTFLGLGCVFSGLSMYTVQHFKMQQLVIPTERTWRQSCSREIGSLEDWILPPSNLAHALNDTELFWRASFVPMITGYPFSRKPKIAFMFLSMGSLPLAPLWERFFKGHEGLYSIYIHSSPSYNPDFKPSSVFYSRQIPSQTVEWGTISMCDAERRLLANALLDQSNEWFVLLSESCIPLHNFSVVYDYISRSQHSFVGVFDDPGPAGRGRYDGNMSPEVNITDWRKGSQWFEVDRKLAVEIVRDSVYYPKFEQFCWPGCYSDEHYIPTMLSIQFPSLLANRTLTSTDWSRGGPHPATFGEADITKEFFKRYSTEACEYNNQTTNLCSLFARKFAPGALNNLLKSLNF